MKELVVISGKGGTGKTSLVGAFAALAENPVLADCDVDASDLHLILDPRIERREDFSGGKKASIDPDLCTACGTCTELCRFDSIEGTEGGEPFRVDAKFCEGCGVCARFCPSEAISMLPWINGEWFVSETRLGPMVHARLGIAEENSGKLVTLVRREARAIAEKTGSPLLIVDGAPGIGCPVIASLTGADLVLIVTEPTVSGEHDLDRVVGLAEHFSMPACVCVNKSDLNPETASRIEEDVRKRGLGFAGHLSYDSIFSEAQVRRHTVVESGPSRASDEIREVWKRVLEFLEPVGSGNR